MADRMIKLTQKELYAIAEILVKDGSLSLAKKLTRTAKTIKHASAKGKGREFQKWICGRISEALGIPYDQQDDQSLIRSREMGQAGTDVVLREEAFRRFPFDTECKATESISLPAYVLQARANEKPGRHWLLAIKAKSLEKPVVVLDAETFFNHWRIYDQRSGN